MDSRRLPGDKPYIKLKAWVACHELFLDIYRVTRKWARQDSWELGSQARRAAFSGAANIAEGSAKRGPREFRRFLDSALGSLAELSYALVAARDIGLLPAEVWGELEARRDHANRLTWGLYAAIGRRIQAQTNSATRKA
jgi:four helix bundle protein